MNICFKVQWFHSNIRFFKFNHYDNLPHIVCLVYVLIIIKVIKNNLLTTNNVLFLFIFTVQRIVAQCYFFLMVFKYF